MQHLPKQPWTQISAVDLSKALAKSQKWKAPGCDMVPNFWLHHLSATHSLLAKRLSELVTAPDKIPTWLTKGITHLLPKSGETENPKKLLPDNVFKYHIQISYINSN